MKSIMQMFYVIFHNMHYPSGSLGWVLTRENNKAGVIIFNIGMIAFKIMMFLSIITFAFAAVGAVTGGALSAPFIMNPCILIICVCLGSFMIDTGISKWCHDYFIKHHC